MLAGNAQVMLMFSFTSQVLLPSLRPVGDISDNLMANLLLHILSDSVALPMPAQQRAVVLEDSADTKSLVWASFVVLQSETNDQLDKERQLGI